jgi:hypothetical protein
MDICDDVLYTIVSFLRPIDKFCLSNTCKLYNKLKPDFVQVIMEQLEKCLSVNVEELGQFLKNKKGVISGSFILQCLYDENYETDIDIFIPSDNTNSNDYNNSLFETCRFFFNRGYRNTEQSADDQLLKCDGMDDAVNCLRYGLVPAVSYKYKKEGFNHVNIIYTEWNNIFEYIDFYFDFSVCKNIFDFDTLKICDVEGIITKTTKHNTDFNRYRKHISNNNPILKERDPKDVFKDVTQKRITNYQNKGFKIIN